MYYSLLDNAPSYLVGCDFPFNQENLHLIFISRGLKTSILGPKLGSFLVQFFFDNYSFFVKKAIFFFVLHEELKTEENASPSCEESSFFCSRARIKL